MSLSEYADYMTRLGNETIYLFKLNFIRTVVDSQVSILCADGLP